MERKCPKCHHFSGHRSRARGFPKKFLRSAYRCRDCNHQFWVISRKAYQFSGLAGAILVVGVLAWAWPRPAATVAVPRVDRFAELIKRAEAKDPAAEYQAFLDYTHGNDVRVDMDEGQKWLQRAADHGLPEAQYELGMTFYEGRRGVLQDFERGAALIRRAAEGGYPEAQTALGIMYRTGNGVQPDRIKSYVWLNIAAANGDKRAPVLRDAALSLLSPSEIEEAQAQARLMNKARSDAPSGR